MRRRYRYACALAFGLVMVGTVAGVVAMQGPGPGTATPPVSSYISVNEEDFRTVFARMRASKAEVEKRQRDLLASRYDLSDRPVAGVTDDTVEFFNLILGTQLTADEKQDLLAFLRTL